MSRSTPPNARTIPFLTKARVTRLCSNAMSVMFLGTFFFAASEAVANIIIKYLHAPLYYGARIGLMLAGLRVLYYVRRRSTLPARLRLGSPAFIYHFVRAGLWTCSAVFFALAFEHHESQTFSYALTLLHPLWTVALSSLIRGRNPSYSRYILPGVFMMFGVTLYTGVLSPGNELRYTDIFPILAGLFFAAANLMSGRIADDLHHTADVSTYYTMTYAVLLLPLVLLVFWLAGALHPPRLSGVFSQSGDGGVGTSAGVLVLMALLIVSAMFSLLANMCITQAFSVSKNDAAVSSIDLTIIVFAVIIDAVTGVFYGEYSFFLELLGIKGLGVITIGGAAVIVTWLYEDEVKK